MTFEQYPATAELLMRSRYCAYILKNENYLLNTWHQSTRPKTIDLQNDTTKWKKLKVISSTENKVHFVAYFINLIQGKEGLFALFEESDFIKEKQWFLSCG